MSVPIYRSEALIVRHLDYGESDRIVTLLTPQRGLFKGFARAARKSRKRFGVALEPFCRVELHWRSGRGGICSLQEVELLDARPGLRADLQAFALASYGVELLELLLEEGDAHPEIYQLLQAYLDFLCRGGCGATARLLLELRLVQQLGYIPHLLHCSECLLQFTAETQVAFDPERGGSLCLGCAGGHGRLRVSVGTLGSLARSLRSSVELFEGFRFGRQTLAEGVRMLSLVLAQVLPRQPRSLRFLQETWWLADP